MQRKYNEHIKMRVVLWQNIYKGEILWDKSKPDGTPKKNLDISRIKHLGWKPRITLEQGIIDTLKSYEKQYK